MRLIDRYRRAPEGTRFKLFPQPPFLENFMEPEVVTVSALRGTVGPGPSDNRMYTVVPIDKPLKYGMHTSDDGEPFMFLPPWTAEALPPVMPDADGHFDYLEPGSKAFEAAHLFGTVRFVLDIWEGFFGREIPWHFAEEYDRLELSILPSLRNAIIGWGFLETGVVKSKEGIPRNFSLNFDVIAHEVGHAIIYSMVGLPSPEENNAEYFGFHESAADLAALIASLHFDSVVDTILSRTSGNLYTVNKLSQFAELGQNDQIRMAANSRVMSEFADGWTKEHHLSEPLTGAIFDILVDIFHENLIDRGILPPELEDLSDRLEGDPEYAAIMQGRFDEMFAGDPGGFRAALLDARDYMGTYLAESWVMLQPDTLSYVGVGEALKRVDRSITGGRYENIIDINFRIREIGQFVPGPQKSKKDETSHVDSVRTMVPDP